MSEHQIRLADQTLAKFQACVRAMLSTNMEETVKLAQANFDLSKAVTDADVRRKYKEACQTTLMLLGSDGR